MPSVNSQRIDFLRGLFERRGPASLILPPLEFRENETMSWGASTYRLDAYLPDFHAALDLRGGHRDDGRFKHCMESLGLYIISITDDAWKNHEDLVEALRYHLNIASKTSKERKRKYERYLVKAE